MVVPSGCPCFSPHKQLRCAVMRGLFFGPLCPGSAKHIRSIFRPGFAPKCREEAPQAQRAAAPLPLPCATLWPQTTPTSFPSQCAGRCAANQSQDNDALAVWVAKGQRNSLFLVFSPRPTYICPALHCPDLVQARRPPDHRLVDRGFCGKDARTRPSSQWVARKHGPAQAHDPPADRCFPLLRPCSPPQRMYLKMVSASGWSF